MRVNRTKGYGEEISPCFGGHRPESSATIGGWPLRLRFPQECKSPEIHLAHPLKTRPIAESRIKIDRIDQAILAKFLRTDLLPGSSIPTRKIREVLRYRSSLVSLRTALKNRRHAILSKHGIIVEDRDILAKRANVELKALEEQNCNRLRDRRIYHTDRNASAAHRRGDQDHRGACREQGPGETAHDDPRHRLLFSALDREQNRRYNPVSNAKKRCSYAGLVPSVSSSGGKTRHATITKFSSKWLRRIRINHPSTFPGVVGG